MVTTFHDWRLACYRRVPVADLYEPGLIPRHLVKQVLEVKNGPGFLFLLQ